MNTYEFMDQNLALSYCFSPNSDVGLAENVAENKKGKKQFAKFRRYKSKMVNMFIIFIQ